MHNLVLVVYVLAVVWGCVLEVLVSRGSRIFLYFRWEEREEREGGQIQKVGLHKMDCVRGSGGTSPGNFEIFACSEVCSGGS